MYVSNSSQVILSSITLKMKLSLLNHPIAVNEDMPWITLNHILDLTVDSDLILTSWPDPPDLALNLQQSIFVWIKREKLLFF